MESEPKHKIKRSTKRKLKKQARKEEKKERKIRTKYPKLAYDGVALIDKEIFFKYAKKYLPIQSHETYPASLDPTEISLVRTCAQLSQCSYGKIKNLKWPKEVGDPVYSRELSKITRIPFYINNSEPLNTIFVTCRGTCGLDDLLTDLMGNCVEVCGGKMHQGVYDTASYVFYNSQSYIINLYRQYHRRVVFTGHSLGGAVASCVCEMMHMAFPDIECRCIAIAPPPTVDLNLWAATRTRTKSFIIEGDCIPFLSLENCVNIAIEVLPPKIANVCNNLVQKVLKTTSGGSYDPAIQVQLTPPGELYLIVVDDTGTVDLRSIEPVYFDRLVRGLQDCIHAMENYVNTINNYFKYHT